MAATSELTTLTRYALNRMISDTVKQSYPAAKWLMGKAEKLDGYLRPYPIRNAGITVDHPAEFGPLGMQHVEMFTDIRPTALASYHGPATVTRKEKRDTASNSTAIKKMYAGKLEGVRDSLVSKLETDVISGIASSAFPGTLRMIGFRNAITTNAYFNLGATLSYFTRKTYASALTVADDLVVPFGDVVGQIEDEGFVPDRAFMSRKIWEIIHREMYGREQVEVSGPKDTYYTGARSIVIRGVRCYASPKAATVTPYDCFIVTSDTWNVDYRADGDSDGIWTFSEPRTPSDAHVETTHVDTEILMVCDNMRANGVLTITD
jgi:hypothetical protein